MSQHLDTSARTALATTQTASTIPCQTLSDHSQRVGLGWAKRIAGIALTGLSLSLLANGKAEAVSFTFKKVADTNTPIPGGSGTFVDFDSPSLDNGNVAFADGGEGGIYTDIGGKLNVVADKNTPIPGGTGNFKDLYAPSLDNGNVAFTGGIISLLGDLIENGVYTIIGGKLNVVANLNTPVPGGTGNFVNFSAPSLDNANVAFRGSTSSASLGGIYTNIGGKLNVVADKNTPIPGGTGNFVNFFIPSLDNGNVAFAGSDANNTVFNGIYTNIGGKLHVVADRNTPIPGGTGNFKAFYAPSLDNGNVAFSSSGEGQRGYILDVPGIYTNVGGKLNVVADKNTPIPGGAGNFKALYAPSLDNGNVAFLGGNEVIQSGNYQPGIYTDIGGKLVEVIGKGYLLDGKEVSDLGFGSEGLSRNQIAFTAEFDDGSKGIYIATVAEPAQR